LLARRREVAEDLSTLTRKGHANIYRYPGEGTLAARIKPVKRRTSNKTYRKMQRSKRQEWTEIALSSGNGEKLDQF